MPNSDQSLGAALGKFLPPLMGFVGAVIMLSYRQELPPRQWATSILFGVVAAYVLPPIAAAWLRYQFDLAWLPGGGHLEGLLGLLLGMAGMYLVAALHKLGERFADDPVGTIKRGRRR